MSSATWNPQIQTATPTPGSTGTTANKEKYTIGRDSLNDIVLDHPSVSRRHCAIVFSGSRGETIELIDFNATNGTKVREGVDWVRITHRQVKLSEPIQVGHFETTVSSLLLKLDASKRVGVRKRGSKIFISYRRSESSHLAGRICDRLSQHYAKNHIFFDVDAISVGVDFKTRIRTAIEDSAILLALVGKNWLSQARDATVDAAREDHVVSELEMAIECRVPIIPILFDGAEMPLMDKLPATLRGLQYINAAVFRNAADFHSDMNRVVELINRELPETSVISRS